MTNEQIEKFLTAETLAKRPIRMSFKTRNTITALFLNGNDFNDLKQKNFWRVVTEANMESWKKSQDNNLTRIFNGAEITKLTLA